MSVADQLGLFVQRAEELRDMRLLRNEDLAARMNLRWDRIEGGPIGIRNPDKENLRSFLLTFRQFVSPKEPVFLYSIYNLCHKRLTSEERRGYLIASRKHWKESQQGNGIVVTIDDQRMTPEHVTDLWINGFYFHNDVDRRRELLGLIPAEHLLVRWVFLNYVVDSTRQVLYVAHVVKASLSEGYIDLS